VLNGSLGRSAYKIPTCRGHHARRAYQHICIIGDTWSYNIRSGMCVMPEGRNADAALHRDTDSYIWAYEH
jgi:hypothetical protein